MKVYDAAGRELTLVEPALGGGAEGKVYAIQGYSRVAKIYLSDARSHRDKVEAMVSLRDAIAQVPELRNVAWPMVPLYADGACAQFVGYGMRKVEGGGHLSDVYAYNSGSTSSYPMADRISFLIKLADAVAALHGLGQVVGDFNDNNIPVLPGGHAALVDVDSFHIRLAGKTFPCEVCKPGYVAPELMRNVRGTTYAACRKPTFTKETDRFSLAVHVFRNLFNGVHPYHCAAQPNRNGSVPAPLPQDMRVERGETPFFVNVAQVRVPAFAPSVNEFPDYLTKLFRRAFVEGHTHPERRPTADEWSSALRRYRGELVTSCQNAAHAHWKGANGCPYCAADARFRATLGGLPRRTGSVAPKAVPTGRTSVPTSGVWAGAHAGTSSNPRVTPFAAPIPSATSNQAPGKEFLFATICGSLCSSIIGAAIVNAVLFEGAFKWTLPAWLHIPVFIGGIVATWYFDEHFAKDEGYSTAALAIAFALVGNFAVALGYAFICFVLPIILILLVIGLCL